MTAILGGGVAGLSAAYYALENPKLGSLILYEASNRLGGWIRSVQSKNNMIFEKGPRTLRPVGKAGINTLKLIDELNLTDKIIPILSSHPSVKNRMVYAGGQLHLLPNSLAGLFKVNSPFKRPLFTVLANDFFAKREYKDDESMYSFVQRRFGTDVADYLISPMLCGICAGDAHLISVKFLMKNLFEIEQKYGIVGGGVAIDILSQIFAKKRAKSKEISEGESKEIGFKTENENFQSISVEKARKENWSIWHLRGGMQQLPQALSQKLQTSNVKLQLDAEVENITFKSNCVELEINGEIQKYERIISSLSSQNLGKILERQHPELAGELRAIPAVSVGVINFEFPGRILPTEAFGFLVPPKEEIPILGVIFDSCIFSLESSTVLTVMVGGAWFNHYFGKNPTKEHLEAVALEQLKKILKITVDPLDSHTEILNNCIPQYIVGHEARCERICNYITAHKMPLAICGSSYEGVGINDVILSAKQAVNNISLTCV